MYGVNRLRARVNLTSFEPDSEKKWKEIGSSKMKELSGKTEPCKLKARFKEMKRKKREGIGNGSRKYRGLFIYQKIPPLREWSAVVQGQLN